MGPVWASVISAAGLVIVAFTTFALNERAKRIAAWRDKKLEYYAEFFDSLAQNIEGYATPDTHALFARRTNNLSLIASPEVITALTEYREQIAVGNTNRDYSRDALLLTSLVKAMRIDLGVPASDALRENSVRLWAPGPKLAG